MVRRGDRWVAWLSDQQDAVRILRSMGPDSTVQAVERLGPFVRWAPGSGAEGDGESLVNVLARCSVVVCA